MKVLVLTSTTLPEISDITAIARIAFNTTVYPMCTDLELLKTLKIDRNILQAYTIVLSEPFKEKINSVTLKDISYDANTNITAIELDVEFEYKATIVFSVMPLDGLYELDKEMQTFILGKAIKTHHVYLRSNLLKSTDLKKMQYRIDASNFYAHDYTDLDVYITFKDNSRRF